MKRPTICIRHDDLQLTVYSPMGPGFAPPSSTPATLRGCGSSLASTVSDRYKVRVADDGTVIGLWRR